MSKDLITKLFRKCLFGMKQTALADLSENCLTALCCLKRQPPSAHALSRSRNDPRH